MQLTEMIEVALGDFGQLAPVGVPAHTPGAVQVVALCRHKVDGVVAHAGQTYWQERARAEAGMSRDIVHVMGTASIDWWGAKGRTLSPFEDDIEQVYSSASQHGSLRIAQGCGYDPGSAAYRFHSAINQCTKHASAFTRFADTNPHCSLRQYDGLRDAPIVRESLLKADVVHCHMNYLLSANTPSHPQAPDDSPRPVTWKEGQWIVRHYHGSRPDNRTNLEHSVDAKVRRSVEQNGGGLIRVGARLTLCAEEGADDLKWLPITIPVARYRALRAEVGYTPYDGSRAFRIAHSPTKRSYKGTDAFKRAIDALQAKGLRVEPVMIENRSHGDALRLKATCDATFDSFWLGIQGSGLEAAAMGMPVIAGDPDVKALYNAHVGHVPYTFAGNDIELARVIERLVTDDAYRTHETERVIRYVGQYHDYPAVARIYERILADAMGREDILTAAPVQRTRKRKVA